MTTNQQPPSTTDATDRSGPAAEAEEEYVELTPEEWEDPGEPNTFPTGPTLEADRRDATATHRADPVDPEALEAAPEGPVAPSVAEAERTSTELGASTKGEGRI